jgi:multicomponent Na+:H+ antiporter subunit G
MSGLAMTPADWVAALFMLGGAFFLVVSSVGLIRLPDFYSRSHAVGKSETLGSLLLLSGLVIYNGFALESAKLLLIVVLIAATNPSGIHVLTRAALRKGLVPWIHPDDQAEADRLAQRHRREARAEYQEAVEAAAEAPAPAGAEPGEPSGGGR